ncbi:MAG TPA: hypothetical protein ENI34_00970 [candidate division WOR-3 bacterium]|uniref:Uncharacterized protein n=1 Tax=candidate division WOR-3 bacterium TaxID=2052148 RepID=A0A9C9JZE2_UNCW3|nr:hypothetical protein [candidate division WOR-3 bacterium]
MREKRICLSMIIAAFIFCLKADTGFSFQVSKNEVRSVPQLLNYQGYLTDSLQIPLDDTLDMVFKIYDASSGGNELWNETQTGVIIERGVFSVLLGSVNAIPDSVFTAGTARWLELTVGGEVLSPRTRITSVGYAYTATYSDTAEYARNAVADNDWQVSGNDMWSIPWGSVGIGTSTPVYKLSIDGKLNVYGGDISLDDHKVDHWQDYNIAVNTGGVLGIHCDGGAPGQELSLRTDGNLYVDGSIGVGTTTPAEKIDVNGTVQMIGFKMPTGAADGYVLTSDSSGVGTWQPSSGGSDNDWVRGTPDSVLFTANYLSIARGGAGNVFYGNNVHTHVNFGVACTTGHSDIGNDPYTTISGGYGHRVRAEYTTISGGRRNYISNLGYYGFIGGGSNNSVGDGYAMVGGGTNNTAGGRSSVVCGGSSNSVNELFSTIVGGISNTVDGYRSGILGGQDNYVSGNFASLVGGCFDTVRAWYGGVLSGYSNLAGDAEGDTAAIVVGGRDNAATGYYCFVGGGKNNRAAFGYSITLGGFANVADSYYAAVMAGEGNKADGSYSFVGGGFNNAARALHSTVAGGNADTVNSIDGFATNYSTYVLSSHSRSAAFTTSHTTSSNQVRAANFSTGTLVFTMDHPFDPMNKILNQYAVGSSEPVFVYNGTAYIKDNGRVEVKLPDYFDEINKNPRIQLTGVGTYEIYVAEKIKNNRFVIGGKPGTEVYWTVTAERKDVHARIAKILTPVEQPKTGHLIGHSLDDDAMIGIYDRIKTKGDFHWLTEEGRRVHQESKKILK